MEAFIYRAWIVGGVLFKDEKRQIKLWKKLKKLLTNIERCDTMTNVAKNDNKQELKKFQKNEKSSWQTHESVINWTSCRKDSG
jgi:hypothetical protein